jgi:D-alanyl-D-alanine carboxypeptidase (penicillin-binding protein 5/6)
MPFLLVLVFLTHTLCVMDVQAATKKKKKSSAPASSGVTAQAAYAVDYTNKKVLFSRNPHQRMYPASTTKLMTALVVLDLLDLEKKITIPAVAVCVEPTKAGLSQNVRYSVSDLLKVMVATSANDAAVALAVAAAGSEEKFALLMTKKAQKLGARNTRFANASGLPNQRQYTTAYDLSIITRAAFSHPFIEKVMKRKTVTITGSDGVKITRNNHNKLLWRVSDPCVLGKTGYTRAAGHCYAGIAYFGNRRASVVILKSQKPWQDLYNILNIKKPT